MSDYKEQCWKRYMENKKYERYDKEDLIDEIIEMQGEIERLNNIIKEVREYANNIMFETKAEEKIQDDILEILDKENK